MGNEEHLAEMKNGAVTFLDILGWKGVWQRKQDAINDLLKLIKHADKNANTLLEKEIYADNFNELSVEVKSISDTLVIVTYGGCDQSLEFHALLSGVCVCQSILLGLPVRGATCYGKFTTEGNIMIGPAVDEVASWYEVMDWIGVILTPSAMLQYNSTSVVQNIIVEYDAPLKQSGKFNVGCVNWPGIWAKKKNEEELKRRFLDMGPLTPDVAKKIMNSLNFYKENSSNKLRNNRKKP